MLNMMRTSRIGVYLFAWKRAGKFEFENEFELNLN
jgi:hypothetical protein